MEKSTGWVCLHRKMMDNQIFKSDKLWKMYTWCLLKATHKEVDQVVGRQIVNLKPGQFVTGRHSASKELGFKSSTTNDLFNQLKFNNIISINSNNKFSVITLIGWDIEQVYQEGTVIKDSIRIGNKSDNTFGTNNNLNNLNNLNNKDYAQMAEQLWSIYPKKKGKAKAMAKIPKLIKEFSYEELERAIKRYTDETKGRDTQYIKQGDTFFNVGYVDYLDDNYQPTEREEEDEIIKEFQEINKKYG
ncbi:hypothetical protein [Alkalibacter saccharofermentans]|uniref:Uncharacterized protein n=1 Tax=Alkalibacter saccharofermentans DSM 14828 TaxID=1120975 RepID=A0A1M4ZI75_9FIRM|nr:hypothetical protein [Alkalibacter saccharofermentans]SHF17743.1 hypothetical protein SAMN02746064_02059 [Alkalibacter saccharofermentans DSM 14828]